MSKRTFGPKFSLILIALVVSMSPFFALGQSLSCEETLEEMMDIAGVKPGLIIGEIGSGGGPFTFRMAERVGKNGKIYANDIDQKALDSINKNINKKNIQNIETVLGEIDDPVFPVRNLHMVIMRSVFHDLENPLSMLENIKIYLKRGAPLVVIEQLPFEYLPIHVMTKESLLRIFRQSSFKPARIDASLPNQWIIFICSEDEAKGRNVWAAWLNEFLATVANVQKTEEDTDYSVVKKRIFWERVLNSYRDNNPNSEEDERLREYIRKRIELLRERAKQYTPPHEDTQDSNKCEDLYSFHLRSEYKAIDIDDIPEIMQMLGFRVGIRGKRLAESGDFKNQFEPLSITGDDVVVDHATGLMWHQSGSEEPMDFFDAQEWIDDLNIQRHAGYSDWRLPTVDEAVSLFETKKLNGKMQIDPLFSDIQSVIWTGDAYYPGRQWMAMYSNSMVWFDLKINPSWVRPVRSLR
jgi:ubiquinone/menaquinone biosynthesis C-methylase UbiE